MLDTLLRLSGLWWCTASVLVATAVALALGVLAIEMRGRRS